MENAPPTSPVMARQCRVNLTDSVSDATRSAATYDTVSRRNREARLARLRIDPDTPELLLGHEAVHATCQPRGRNRRKRRMSATWQQRCNGAERPRCGEALPPRSRSRSLLCPEQNSLQLS